jgi:DNA-binding MarR family transcriptional regulator
MASWTFITHHGSVLALISEQGTITTRTLAGRLGITERSVQRIVKELEAEGYIRKQRIGRANHYEVNIHAQLKQADSGNIEVGELLQILNKAQTVKADAPTPPGDQFNPSRKKGAT